MFTERIKELTLTHHQILEKALIGRLKAIRSVDAYADLLKLFYGYFGGLETLINGVFDIKQLPDMHQRRKTQAIANDIKELNSDVPIFADKKQLPVITTHLEALGALYVMEGSTLGGKIISKMLQQHLTLNGKGLSFFNGYGDETEKMWETFKDALNNQVTTHEQEAMVIKVANETFSKFGEWLNAA